MSPAMPVALITKMAVRQTMNLGDVRKMTSWWDLWGTNRIMHLLIRWDIYPLALPPHYKYNYSSCRAATLLHFSPVDKNMLKVPLKKVYKLWFPCRKWASREKWICIFHYHHPFLAGVTRKYLDRMYVISLGRNWLSWNPEKILPWGRRNQSCRNSQLEISFQTAG